jgi:hypothetical protein
VPFWNKSTSSIADKIRSCRPDIQLPNIPIDKLKMLQPVVKQRYMPNVSQKYSTEHTDTKDWYVCCIYSDLTFYRLLMEKYNGVRVYWDGKTLRSSFSRMEISVPQNLSFPALPFEGVVW